MMLTESYLINLVVRSLQCNDTSSMEHLLWVFLIILSVISCLQWLVNHYCEVRKLPPGPWGFPVIGYLLFMGNEKHTRFMELAKRYGSLFSTRLGSQLTVVMSDYKMIRECFRRDEFTGRPDTPFMQTLNGFGEFPPKISQKPLKTFKCVSIEWNSIIRLSLIGIINSTGKLWKDQRRFLHEKLRQFGMTYMGNGKHIMEKRIMVIIA